MKKTTFSCGLEAALVIAGGKWDTLVLYHLAAGPRRFGELRRLVRGISEKMLIQTLRELEGYEVISRRDYRENPPRVDYSLTRFGVSLSEALRPLCEWGTKHMTRIARLRNPGGQD